VRRPLRVLTLTDVISSTGGAERVATMLAESLDRERFTSWICATRPVADEPVLERLRRADVRTLVLRRSGKLDAGGWLPLVSLLRRERIDIVHAHKFGSNVWAVALGRLTRVPVVIAHEHTWSYVGQPARRFLDRELIGRFADAFVAVSPEDRRRMVEIERVPEERIRLVLNAVPAHAPTGKDVRAELGISPDAPVVVAVGRIRAQKAFDFLVEVAAGLRDELPGLRVLIAGDADPGLDDALRAQVGALGLASTVLLLGRRDDVADLLETADVAVLSSDYEGAPLAAMEYMAAGKAIVSTDVGGVPALIDDGVHGLLVPPRDRRAMTAAIGSLLRDPERAHALGRAAAERHRTSFALEAMVARVEALYEELFARSARARRESF
jgi:glycosyltransferase involved in cell wall biosynthesis